MANGNGNEGTTAGNRQINANTGVTIGLVLAVVIATSAAIYKAGEVITDLGYVKTYVAELRVELAEVKRVLYLLNRNQGAGTAK